MGYWEEFKKYHGVDERDSFSSLTKNVASVLWLFIAGMITLTSPGLRSYFSRTMNHKYGKPPQKIQLIIDNTNYTFTPTLLSTGKPVYKLKGGRQFPDGSHIIFLGEYFNGTLGDTAACRFVYDHPPSEKFSVTEAPPVSIIPQHFGKQRAAALEDTLRKLLGEE